MIKIIRFTHLNIVGRCQITPLSPWLAIESDKRGMQALLIYFRKKSFSLETEEWP